MFDGSVEIFEMLKRPDTVVVIPTVGDKILLQTQEQPHRARAFTSLPGGRVDEGEDSLTAANREMLEETGYESDDWTLWKSQRPYSKIDWTIYTYIARGCRRTRRPCLDAGERIATKLITFDEFLMLSEDSHFYEKELQMVLFRAKFDERFREELKKLLFPF